MVKWLRAAVTRRAGLIIAPSRYLAGIISAWGVPVRKIKTIYNAVEVLPDVPPAALPPFRGRTLITVARLVPWKGIGPLIEWVCRSKRFAFAGNRRRTGAVELRIAGVPARRGGEDPLHRKCPARAGRGVFEGVGSFCA